ncbi:MAG: serine/threonine-protein kinase [Polyangiaceae bacterium]
MALLPGTSISADLQLSRPLNEGAMGSVWAAEHAEYGDVAVKFIAGRQLRSQDARARFRREVSVLAELHNLNIVRTFGHGVTDADTPYVIMELLTGESLEERLARERQLPLDDIAAIVMQLGYALSEVHASGIIHRDVKPANIFLVGADDFPLLKLVDFGMARHERVRTGSLVTAVGVSVGTPDYMSPEQVLGSADVDWRCDLWACAVVAYRMLCGFMPFEGESPHALVFSICRGEFSPLTDSSAYAAFQPWFERVFMPDKLKRYAVASEQVAAFQKAVQAALGKRDALGGERTVEYDIAQLMADSAARSAKADSSSVPTLGPSQPLISEMMNSSAQPTAIRRVLPDGAGAEAEKISFTEEELPSLPRPPMSYGMAGAVSEQAAAEDADAPVSEPELPEPLVAADADTPPPSRLNSRAATAFALIMGITLGAIGAAMLWRFLS